MQALRAVLVKERSSSRLKKTKLHSLTTITEIRQGGSPTLVPGFKQSAMLHQLIAQSHYTRIKKKAYSAGRTGTGTAQGGLSLERKVGV